jgi:hypothetical protein
MLSPSPERIITHSPWRGELFSRAGAPEASGGRPRLSGELTFEAGVDGPAWSAPACESATGTILVLVQAAPRTERVNPETIATD